MIVVKKGEKDLVSDGHGGMISSLISQVDYLIVIESGGESAQRRCGGQGDVLSGAVATFAAWAACYRKGYWRYLTLIILSADYA